MSDRQSYVEIRFTGEVYALIEQIGEIINTYAADGMSMTVRQLYYQLVSKDLIENSVKSYKRIVKIVTDGRMTGLIDWDGIEDRGRLFKRRPHWETGREIIEATANQFHMDLWKGQAFRPFVLIEKDALSGVLSGVCGEYDVPLLACKGYASATAMRNFARDDMYPAIADGQRPIVIHLGDHDPSGIDMTRDMEERLALFLEIEEPEIKRIALNMPQIERMKPPPNPAKQTDARFASYARKFGRKCWELDAIEPKAMRELVRNAIRSRIDYSIWNKRKAEIEDVKARLKAHAAKFKG